MTKNTGLFARILLAVSTIVLSLNSMVTPAHSQFNQDTGAYVFGAATGGHLGGFGVDEGVGLIGLRAGYGHAWDNVAVEGQLAYATFLADGQFANGGLFVPSVSAKYLFGNPGDRARINLGGGTDFMMIVDFDGAGIGFPWGHLMAGVDIQVSPTSDVYFEARTYGLITLAHVGMRFAF